jgi:uncharacterized protein
MVFFWRKQENIQDMINRYFDLCDSCFQLLEKAFAIFLEMGHGEAFNAAVNETHKAESAADDLRRDIEFTLYGKALLPESRGDILGLLETYDRIPNVAESFLFAIKCQHLELPEFIQEDFKRLFEINLQAYYLARKAIDSLFNNPSVALNVTKEVDDKESESDRCERELISKIFSSDLDMGNKLLLKDLVLLAGTISDRCETAADRISIIAIKRNL